MLPIGAMVLTGALLLPSCLGGGTKKAAEKAEVKVDEEGFVAVFDGKTLDGWDYDTVYWSVQDGVIKGEITPETLLERNSFLIKKDLVLGDFELKVEYRVSDQGNSGVSYRNALVEGVPHALQGYQADIEGGDTYTGQNYEERGRQFLALRGDTVVIEPGYVSPGGEEIAAADLPHDQLGKYIKKNDWNEYHIIAKGNRLQHYINGVLMSDVTDNDPEKRRMSGLLGVQVHVGPPMTIEYRNFRVKPL